ncbi:MAG: adenylate/guanylate cyclase domain-containing protein [Alphaproteobacteria bacterium]
MNNAPTNRRLAAILAADVVGYSKLMGVDEVATLDALKQHRGDIFEPAVRRHNGRTFKLMGDGTLVEFASVVEAVKCAIDIQLAIAGRAPEDDMPQIRLRIGVNLGDVIIDGDDVFGDGVNIAARLEPLAGHGGICVSSIVKESVGERVDAIFSDGGEVTLKNIARPLRVWKWQPDTRMPAARIPDQSAASGAGAKKTPAASIAVLPFDNMSGDPEQEYFSDGISEDIITDLSKVGELTVIARNSSFAYKGRAIDLRIVGRELGVTSVLEGSIRRAGNRVRITAQLIDTSDGAHLWAERFDRELTDIFEVQDEVTRHIVAALKLALTPAEEGRLANTATTSPEAHDAFLRGREMTARTLSGREDYEAARGFFSRAIELDPGYADAYAARALVMVMDHFSRWSGDTELSMQRAQADARQAVALGPNEPLAHYAASVIAGAAGDGDGARKSADMALSLNPNFGPAYNARGVQAIYDRDRATAISNIEKAIRLDPANTLFLHFLGMANLFAGNYETAAASFRMRINQVPTTDVSRALLAAALGHLGELEEAQGVWAELKSIKPGYSLKTHMETIFFRNREDADTVLQGLRKAGLPAGDE